MGTSRYGYNQIYVHIHIIMGSQIPIYYTSKYPFSYPPRAHDGFYSRVPMGMCIFATPDQYNRNSLRGHGHNNLSEQIKT